ncbi:MAG: hypothetical protein ACM3QW_07950 [Ignavibacteriales bacterium]
MKLFRAWSMVNNYRGRDQVRFNWFCAQRFKPVAPYAELIKNFDPTDRDAPAEQRTADEYFTGQEVEDLKQYLEKYHHTKLLFEEVALPIERGLMPMRLMPVGGPRDFYKLDSEEDYDLKIPVWSFFNLEGCPQTKDVLRGTSEEANGVRFLQVALKDLGLKVDFEKEYIEDIVRAIFHQDGLYVVKRK